MTHGNPGTEGVDVELLPMPYDLFAALERGDLRANALSAMIRHYARAAVLADRERAPESTLGQPVMWQYRTKLDDSTWYPWGEVTEKYAQAVLRDDDPDEEVRPLYAPQASTSSAAQAGEARQHRRDFYEPVSIFDKHPHLGDWLRSQGWIGPSASPASAEQGEFVLVLKEATFAAYRLIEKFAADHLSSKMHAEVYAKAHKTMDALSAARPQPPEVRDLGTIDFNDGLDDEPPEVRTASGEVDPLPYYRGHKGWRAKVDAMVQQCLHDKKWVEENLPESLRRLSDALDLIATPATSSEAAGGADAPYHELLFAVGNKYPGESRHQTALRYIRQAEQATSGNAVSARTNQSGQEDGK